MGLDLSHGDWTGSHSACCGWRDAIAGLAGLEEPDWADFPLRNYQGEWDEDPSDILTVLIVHSDCDGAIDPRHTGPLADRLEEILHRRGRFTFELPRDLSIGDLYLDTRQFIRALRQAAADGEPLLFQ